MRGMRGFFAILLPALLTVAGGESPGLRGSEVDQVLVFDAGSSGTRIHVFNIRASEDSTAHVPLIDLSVRAKQTMKVKPGLSDFAQRDDTEGAGRNIAQLLDFANQFVPESRRATTPALLKATAGLRSVSEAKAEAVLDSVRRTLSASGYQFKPEWAGIIKGKEEGGLAWVAANYLEGTLNEESAQTLGVIEMGGGSTQVTFQVSPSDELDPDDDFVFESAQGKRFRLYAHSYLGFGQDHAQAAMRGLLDPSGADPCYPKGYARHPASGGEGKFVQGSGDSSVCMAEIGRRLWPTSAMAPGRYAKERPLSGRFVATENFFYTQADEKLGWEDRLLSLADLESAARGVCGKELAEAGGAETADPGVPKTCFGFAYQAELLKAIKATTNLVQVFVKHKIHGGDIDWALGAALIHHIRFVQGSAAEPALVPAWAVVLLVVLGSFACVRALMHFPHTRNVVAQVTGLSPTKIGSSTYPAE